MRELNYNWIVENVTKGREQVEAHSSLGTGIIH
jgi:hypothetical protein